MEVSQLSAPALYTTIVYWGYIGIMEKKMETTIIIIGYMGLRGYIGIMEKNMETTIIQ